MSMNSFGRLLRITTWGESHGPAIGVVVDGCPPGLTLTVDDIQTWLDKRKPGTSQFTTQRREPDQVKIVSGVFENTTTGTPIALMIENTDQRSKDYGDIASLYRPGHADWVYDQKYGLRDFRGGGRSSARETACRVAAGAIARKILGSQIEILGYMVEMGGLAIDRSRFGASHIGHNPFFCPDPEVVSDWEAHLSSARKSGSSLGAVVEVMARGVPVGLGAPVYGKLDSDLAAGLMSINAVKGVEIGDGFAAARLRGEHNADEMRMEEGRVRFLSNHAGGILGGIATGQDIIARIAIKPTSSILNPVQTITREGQNAEISTKGRHDPCVGIRAVPVAEAMMALVLADHVLLHRGQCGN